MNLGYWARECDYVSVVVKEFKKQLLKTKDYRIHGVPRRAYQVLEILLNCGNKISNCSISKCVSTESELIRNSWIELPCDHTYHSQCVME